MLDIFYYENEIKKGKIEDLEKLKDKKIWIDITNITHEESVKISNIFDLHPTTHEDLFKSNVRIKVEEFDKYLFCIFYGVRKNKTIETHELDFVLGKDFIISNHKKSIESYENLKKDKTRLEALFKKGEDFIFHQLLDLEISVFFPVLEEIDETIEKNEAIVAKRPKPKNLDDVLKLKKTVILLKKLTFEQREKVSFLAKRDYKQITKGAIPYFRDLYDNTIRVSDSIETSRELISSTLDIYMSTMSYNMNEVMKVLSIIATLMLPITALSGIYGTNFHVLPGASSPLGFWLMVMSMIITSAGFLIFFKRRGWF